MQAPPRMPVAKQTKHARVFLAEEKASGPKCWDMSGVKLAEKGASSAWTACSPKWSEDCSESGCCLDASMKCYQKDKEWAACKASCDKMDEKNETWTCEVIEPKEPHTFEGCKEQCKNEESCKQAIFDSGAGGSCSLSEEHIPKVVWGGDNFNSSFCGDASEESKMDKLLSKVHEQLPFKLDPLPIVNCSWGGEDCAETKCCNDVACDKHFSNCFGYSCYKKTKYFSGCSLHAPPKSWEGTWIGGAREHRTIGAAGQQVATQGTSLYCFSVVNWKAPAPKPFWSTEAQLAENIKTHGVGIMQCDAQDWYSGIPTPKAEWGSFSNIDAFQQIWKQVNLKGVWKNHDYTVKVDADAVFLPNRLKLHLEKLRVPLGSRVYLENTWYRFKFMGALEILTKEALEVYLARSHECIRGKHEGGEDFFMKGCMDALGIDHMSDTELLHDKYAEQDGPCTDGWAVAYHFHKKVISWNWCYNEVVCGNRGKTCPHGIDVEFVMPWKPNGAE